MARREQDREDLMREATALRERIELIVPDEPEPVVAGFKSSGAWSVYFGGAATYQFDETTALRRAFRDGLLYRSQGHTLARLMRSRTETETHLLRHDLSPAELREFVDAMQGRLARLLTQWDAGSARVVAQVPAEVDLGPRLQQALRAATSAPVRLAPALKG